MSDEAEIAGKGAAQYVKNELTDNATYLKVTAADGVRYVLPQRIDKNGTEEVALYLRVSKPLGKVRYTVRSGDTVLTTVARLKAAPGEMEKIILKPDKRKLASEEIIVSVEEIQ